MKCPDISELPPSPSGKTGWPWAEACSVPNSQEPIPDNLALPRITIVMPCLNAVQYIEEALRSVLLQGYPDLELMVFDGGSTDGTVEIIKQYEPWLAYWKSAKDRGQSHAINQGLERATGELFNWFNADDIMCPAALTTLVDLYPREAGFVGACGAFVQFDEAGKEELFMPVPGTKEQMGYWPDPFFLPQLSSLFSTAACRGVGGVNERFHYAMDMELVLKLIAVGKMAVTDKVVLRFRCHAGSKTGHGYYGGLVEFIVANFINGQARVAEDVLRRRMDGHAKLALGKLTKEDVGKMVDEWSYPQVVRYVGRRLWKNLMVRRSRWLT